MIFSRDRILTTHVGSLPRPDDVWAMLQAKDKDELTDQAAFDGCMTAAVKDVVKTQVELGVDVVSDGEMSKIGYGTYIKDRLTGFSGDSPRLPPRDLAMYPRYMKKIAAAGETPTIRRQLCTGPIEIRDRKPLAKDIANMQAAVVAGRPVDAFMNAASPGVIALFQPNRYYPSHEAYLGALADVMREEYEAIVAAGFVLQVDCPDLAMGRHIMFADESDETFVKAAAQNVEALNHALERVPADRVRMHLCWGNYEGPHVCDVPLEKILGTVLKAKPQAISFEAANPRHGHEWTQFERVKLPAGKVLIPGVIESKSNFIEHPELIAQRIGRYAELVGRENVMVGSDCGYGTWVGQAAVDPDVVWAKFAAMAEGARIASREFWT